ncbi:TIGR00300 family protein [Acidimicrobiia bacterium EGI L10123]|uniref:ornithine cyclodeaminase n=1 Tax=Salinilacustrithrix flava TaxID=2957203 RepID=UPI003D7C347D|nr:TIGR00300 family protein [Acidimicrobiia bacterium EGI L10123]
MATETIEVHGHIVDSLILAKILDAIIEAGADYELADVEIGKTNTDSSRASIVVRADDRALLDALLDDLLVHGANRTTQSEAVVEIAEQDGVLPVGFHSTTNLDTEVLLDGTWHTVENPEMDCGLVVDEADGRIRVRTVPMHRVEAGDRVVVGRDGVRVQAPERRNVAGSFEFMGSEVSSEKPKGLMIRHVAERIRAAREEGGRVLLVAGPAAIHTGAGPDLATLVEQGWISCLFTGNGFATHDLESNVLGTSLGVGVADGVPVEGGHANHVRVINEIRRHGSIAAAVEAGYVSGGVMHACVRAGVPFVLAGSVRDDGPLPDTMTDVAAAADAMRDQVPGMQVALMLATTLHAIATGNILPASVETFCVDINQAVVTKLADRGSHQAVGIVTDIGVFVRQLTGELCS